MLGAARSQFFPINGVQGLKCVAKVGLSQDGDYVLSLSCDPMGYFLSASATVQCGGESSEMRSVIIDDEGRGDVTTIKRGIALFKQINAGKPLHIELCISPCADSRGGHVVNTDFSQPGQLRSHPCLSATLGAARTSPELLELADVELVAEGGEVIQAHQMLLAMRSPVFRATFYGHMKEARTKRAEVRASGEAVRALLDFIYTDQVGTVALETRLPNCWT